METRYKKLPRGWQYPVSKKEVRDFLKSTSANVLLVEFTGVAWHGYGKWKPEDSWCAGEIAVRGAEEGWRYKVKICGFPEELIGETRLELSSYLLAEMEAFISEFESKKLDPLAKTEDLRFFCRDKGGNLEPDFSRWKLDAFDLKFETPWWQ